MIFSQNQGYTLQLKSKESKRQEMEYVAHITLRSIAFPSTDASIRHSLLSDSQSFSVFCPPTKVTSKI